MKYSLLIFLLLAPLSIFAQGYQLNLQGTRQIGKGSTGIAQPTDATALFTNPGSAAFLKQNDFTAGIHPAFSRGVFTDAHSNTTNKTDNPVEFPFNASLLLGEISEKWNFGLSIFTPYGSTNRWEEGSVGRFDIKEISLLSVSFQPTVSYQINDQWGVGAGFIYTFGMVSIKKDLPLQFADGRYAESEIKSNAHGFSANVGVYYKASDKLSLGLSYRSPIDMKASDGEVIFDVPASVAGNFPEQGIKATLPLPQVVGLGVSYKPDSLWVVNAEAYLADWSKYDVIKIDFVDKPVAGENSTELIRHYKTGYSFRLGAEYLPGKNYELRAGVTFNKTPIPNDYVSPDVPDANRLSPSVGASYIFSDNFRMDAALLMEFVHRKGKNIITEIEGTYNYDLFFPSVGLTYKF